MTTRKPTITREEALSTFMGAAAILKNNVDILVDIIGSAPGMLDSETSMQQLEDIKKYVALMDGSGAILRKMREEAK